MSELQFNFSFAKKSRNEPHILAILINLQDVVEQSDEGEFKAIWDEDETTQTVDVTINITNTNLKEVIDGFVDDIEILLNEDYHDTHEQEQEEQEEVKEEEVKEEREEEEQQEEEQQEEKYEEEDKGEGGDGDDAKGDDEGDDDEEDKQDVNLCSTFQEYFPKEQTTMNISSEKIQALDQPDFAGPATENESDSDSPCDVQSSGKSWSLMSESEEWSEESEILDDNTRGIKKRKRDSEKGKEPKKLRQQLTKDLKCKKKKEDNQDLNKALQSEECNEVPNEKRKDNTKADASPISQVIKARRSFSCPMPSCSSKVVHLPRHMRKMHKWTKEAARKVLLKFNIRKRKSPEKSKNTVNKKEANNTSTKKKHKDYHHRRRRCPVSNCHSIVFRLPAHLQKVHKMSKLSQTYREAMLTASHVPDRKHSMIRWKEELTKNRKSDTRKVAEDLGETSTNCMNNISGDESSSEYSCKPSKCGNDSQPGCQLSSEPSLSDDRERSIGEQDLVEEPVRDPVLHQFENWLQSPDGGKRDEKTAKQHRVQLSTILKVIDETSDINSLLNITLVRHIFLKKHVEAKKYEAGTIKSYLMSLRHFFSFLLSDKPNEVHFEAQDVRAMREKVKMWSLSYKKESCTRRWKKLEEDSGNLLTPADIQNFEKSEAARKAVKLLGQYSDPTAPIEITQNAYTLVRDFLFTQIFIENANRPGVLSCMTMGEFKNMRTEGEEWIIAVMKHKTVHIHGPAYVVLNSKLMSWLSIFVNCMRAQVTTSKTGFVFLTWNGQTMTSGQINKAVQSVFKKAQVLVKLTSTSFRKAAVTMVHTRNPELSGKLAGLMAHNEATAKKYYLLSEKTKASVEASQKLRNIMRNKETGPAKESKDSTGSSKESSVDEKKQLSRKGRLPWTPQDVKKVQDTFKEEIERQEITLDIVREKIVSDPQLFGMSPRRVYDRLKNELRKPVPAKPSAQEMPPELSESLGQRVERMTAHSSQQTPFETNDEQSSLGIISPTERSSSLFLDSDVSALRTLFSDMIDNKPITQVEIKKRCADNADGKRMLKNCTVFQLMNRIKYERRMKRNDEQ